MPVRSTQSELLKLRDTAILELLYSSGIRASELAGIALHDIDMDSGTIRVHGKGNKERLVPLGEYARQALRRYLRLRRQCNGEPVFLTYRGRPLGAHYLPKLVWKYAKELNTGYKVTTHTLRHTFATHMLENGCNLRVLQELLGHKNISTTQIYTHVSTTQLQQAFQNAHPRARIK